MPERLPWIAIAPPEIPAIRAWLSLVGIPNHQARRGPDHNGEHGGAEGDQGIVGVAAEIHHVVDGLRHGLVLMAVITKTPRKLKTAAIMIAGRAPMLRVETQVAMALGASVQPLTKITPRVKMTVTARTGLENSPDKNCSRDNMPLPLSFKFQTLLYRELRWLKSPKFTISE